MKITSFFLLFAIAILMACSKNTNELASKKLSGEMPELLERNDALKNGKEWEETKAFYEKQLADLKKDPTKTEPKLKLVECFLREARITGEHPHYYSNALKLVEAVLEELKYDEKNADKNKYNDLIFRALCHKASIQLSLHKFAEAKTSAEKAVKINPHNSYIYGCLVDACVELGDLKTAVEMCDKMVGIRPDLRSYSRVSYLRELHNDLSGAIEAMDLAVKGGVPGSEETEWARLELGNLLAKNGDTKSAEMIYQICLQNRPNYPFAIAAAANLEAEKGKFDVAEQGLKKAIEVIPEIGFYIDLAKIYKKTGQHDLVAKLIPEIEEMFRSDIEAGHNMALEAARFHLDITGNMEKAKTFALDEFAARPKNAEVLSLMERF